MLVVFFRTQGVMGTKSLFNLSSFLRVTGTRGVHGGDPDAISDSEDVILLSYEDVSTYACGTFTPLTKSFATLLLTAND